MLIAMAGLPGAGKSTLARALAPALNATVLDKDQVRACLFGPSLTEHSDEQNDFCVDVMYRTVEWTLRRHPDARMIIDGRTYLRRAQVAELRRVARRLDVPLWVLECRCADDVAVRRLHEDRAAGRHPASDRDAGLYRRLRADAEPIEGPTLVVDTGRPVAACVEQCLRHLLARDPGYAGPT